MSVVILAGGRGARAYPFTGYLPKPIMPVHGKPMLVRIMEFFADHGRLKIIGTEADFYPSTSSSAGL